MSLTAELDCCGCDAAQSGSAEQQTTNRLRWDQQGLDGTNGTGSPLSEGPIAQLTLHETCAQGGLADRNIC